MLFFQKFLIQKVSLSFLKHQLQEGPINTAAINFRGDHPVAEIPIIIYLLQVSG